MRTMNPELYWRLKAQCNGVKVMRQGLKTILKWEKSAEGKEYEKVVQAGEAYAINCPICEDTTGRCTVNYLFGSENKFNAPRINMAHCYNDGCSLQSREVEAFEKLERLFITGDVVKILKPKLRVATKVIEPFDGKLPGTTLPLSGMQGTDEVVQMLRDRRFNPQKLGEIYGLGFCVSAPQHLRGALNKLIIPVKLKSEIVSWQARRLRESQSKAKYWTAPNSFVGDHLYNIDRARRSKFVVITEGVTDVWRLGRGAVCTFGAKIGSKQEKLLKRCWKSGGGMLLFDSKKVMTENIARVCRELNETYAGGFVVGELPDERDPGDWKRADLWQWIESEYREKSGRKLPK